MNQGEAVAGKVGEAKGKRIQWNGVGPIEHGVKSAVRSGSESVCQGRESLKGVLRWK